ncbi:MAG: hypothetical protein R2824_06680 [Saprospiraceae bacterium]|nr:hypothetical protein [Lewinella sp.]
MRIIGYVQHPVWKITVFKTDTRLSVKFEDGLLEQTYKFVQQDRLNALGEVQQLIDQKFILTVERRFREMERHRAEALARHTSISPEDEFDTII